MKKLEEKIKRIKSETIIYIGLSVLSIFYFTTKITNSELSMLLTAVSIVAFTCFIIGNYFIFTKLFNKKLSLEKYFLIFSIVFGSLYLFGFPPSQIPDEQADHLRALEVSQFHLTTPQKKEKVGRRFATNIAKIHKIKNYNDVIKYKDVKLNGKKQFYKFANKSLYAFVCYIPQSIGIFIATLFNLPIIMQVIFGKLFNYILYVLLIYLSIKHIPFKKELIFFISLLPMSLQEAVSLSPDSMIIATIIALTSFILYQRENKNTTMNNKNKILLSILAITISLCKIVYLPLVFLIFLIPDKKFKSKKEKYIYCSIVCLISIIVNLYWLSISSKYLVAFHSRSNSSLQLKYIITHPLNYCILLFRTFDYYILIYLEELVGCSLGQFIVGTSPIIVLLSIIILILLVSGRNKKGRKVLKLPEKIYITALLIATILLMYTSLYLQWTGYKETMVDGVQGRYFIPMIPILSLLFMKEKELIYDKKLIYFVWFMDIMSVIAICKTFI